MITVIVGIYSILTGNEYKEERAQVIMYVTTGIIIISITIINYIFYLRRNLKDLNPIIREKNKIATIKIGEILELIIFAIFVIMPIWRIPEFIKLLDDKRALIIEIVKAFCLSIISVFLLFSLNPLNIRSKFKNDKENKNSDKDKKII